MIFPAILAISFLHGQTAQISETKLFRNQKGKIAPGSIAISPNLQHYSYGTPDHKLIIDGKTFGPYISNGAVLYSGDSKDYAFLATLKSGEPSKIFWNGVERSTDNAVSSLFRAGETGGICWGEYNKDSTRMVYPGGVTDWFEKIEKVFFSDDGSLFAMRTSEKIATKDLPPDATGPTSRDFIVRQDGTKVPRGRTIQIFPAPNSQGFALLTSDNEVIFKGRTMKFAGEFYGKPMFSPDGKQFAFRNSVTGPTPDGRNIQFYQYNIGGFSIPDLQLQTGLTFAPDGKKWVMCGLNGKQPFLYVSSSGLMPYEDFPLLNGAPPEPYKAAKFANDKIVLLFQPSRAKPFLFVEGKGIFEMGAFTASPDTMSISPDGKWLVIAGSDIKETRAFMVNLEAPGAVKEILKPGYDLQNLGKGTFVWSGNNEVQFVILRNSELIRISAKL